jgi:hypothetical protein
LCRGFSIDPPEVTSPPKNDKQPVSGHTTPAQTLISSSWATKRWPRGVVGEQRLQVPIAHPLEMRRQGVVSLAVSPARSVVI